MQHSIEQEFEQDLEATKNEAAGSCCGWGWLKTAALLLGTAAAAAATANTLIALRTPPPDDRLGGLFERYPGRLGDIAYAVSGNGSPLLLLHALHPGASMAEWAENFDALAQHFTVYAPDFLGWCASDKPAARYDGDEYAEQIEFFIEDVIGGPCAVVASGQSAAYALRAAARRPDLFTNVVLICPPLADESDGHLYGPHRAFYELLKLPLIGQTLYNWLTARPKLQEFAARHLFFDKNRVDGRLVTAHHIAAHQPGARHAPRSIWTGLANVNPLDDWSNLSCPGLLIWGRNALQPPVDTAPEWLALKPDAHLEVVDEAMLLPHAEHPARFNKIVTDWLKRG
jgi:pimeloyl-ACP methyl ester carboxylesterase